MAASLTTAAVNAVISITLQTVYDQKTVNDLIAAVPTAGSPGGGAADAWDYFSDLSDFLAKIAGGAFSANVVYVDGNAAAQAVGTITFTGNLSNNDTITLAGVTITFVTGTPSGSQVKIGSSQAATMANLITFINAGGSSGNIAGVVTAKQNSTNVIGLTAVAPGIVGNFITLTKSAANISGVVAPTGGAAVSQSGPISAGI